ncbi:MAG: ribbon-helix-helix domain-containing protein [Thermodesulfobacteriota bacterium]|nr:ribbon-helix-helix domain-containing protein [Thermodesulfobacteriota bacterium]
MFPAQYLTLSLPPQLLAKVERLAKQDNRNKSEFLREALRLYLEERERRDVLKYAKKKSIQQGVFTEEDIEQIVDEVHLNGKGGRDFRSPSPFCTNHLSIQDLSFLISSLIFSIVAPLKISFLSSI